MTVNKGFSLSSSSSSIVSKMTSNNKRECTCSLPQQQQQQQQRQQERNKLHQHNMIHNTTRRTLHHQSVRNGRCFVPGVFHCLTIMVLGMIVVALVDSLAHNHDQYRLAPRLHSRRLQTRSTQQHQDIDIRADIMGSQATAGQNHKTTTTTTTANNNNNEVARKVLEQILRQYYAKVLGSPPALVESRVVSKRDRELTPSVSEYNRAPTPMAMVNSLGAPTGSNEDHNLLIEQYGQSLTLTPTPPPTPSHQPMAPSSSVLVEKRRDSSINLRNSVGDNDSDNYIETILNEIALDHLLRHHHNSRATQPADTSTTIVDGDNLDAQEKSLNYLNEMNMASRSNNNNNNIDDKNNELSQLLRERLHKASKNNNNNNNVPQLEQLDGSMRPSPFNRNNPSLSRQNNILPIFDSSMASPLAFESNFPKRQIRFHQCYFNPISCFRKRK